MNEELSAYLDQARGEAFPFSPEETTEALLSVYNIIEWVLKDECSVIEVLPNKIIWRKDTEGQIVGDFAVPIDLRPVFKTVLRRDPTLRKHLQTIEESSERTKYHIT